jgi:hypothetical protein
LWDYGDPVLKNIEDISAEYPTWKETIANMYDTRTMQMGSLGEHQASSMSIRLFVIDWLLGEDEDLPPEEQNPIK